jgi:hypothetical protein
MKIHIKSTPPPKGLVCSIILVMTNSSLFQI